MKKYVPLQGRFSIGYLCRKHGQKTCYKKTRFYWSTCYDKKKKFYYCHGFYRISSETNNCFLEHQHSMSQFFSWSLCLSPFHNLLYLLNLFGACFILVTLITPCNMPHIWSDWLFHIVLFLLSVIIHVITACSDI